jgi:hypothetical protein
MNETTQIFNNFPMAILKAKQYLIENLIFYFLQDTTQSFLANIIKYTINCRNSLYLGNPIEIRTVFMEKQSRKKPWKTILKEVTRFCIWHEKIPSL